MSIVYRCEIGHEFLCNAIARMVACRGDDGACCHYAKMILVNGELPTFNVDGIKRIIFRKVNDFGRKETRIKGAWMDEILHGRRSIYITCGQCGAINDGSDFQIQYDGTCECFHCGGCGCDHFIMLDGFNEMLDVPRKRLDWTYQFHQGRIYRRLEA